MFIDKICLSNVRGFRSLDFDLRRPDGSHAGWTVFTGDNGSGKSTLLKAVAMTLVGPDTRRALQPSLHRWLHSGTKKGFMKLDIKPSDDDTRLKQKGNKMAPVFSVRLELTNGGKQTDLTQEPEFDSKNKRKPSRAERTIWAAGAGGWFSCGYGPFRRVFGASTEATEIMAEPVTARYATMFQEAASLARADRWLKELDHKAAREPSSKERALRDDLITLLQDEFMPNGMRIERVDEQGLWLVDRNGVELSWDEMSDGYRSALALVVDIVRHLTFAHEDEKLSRLIEKGADGQYCIKSSGVVLIDEIDAHLHPEWQREIGFWLKRHFPNIQFIVTSHSPIICQAADENGLFVLPEPGSGREPRRLEREEYQKIIASRSDTILRTSAFGLESTRSPHAVEILAEHSRMVAKRRAMGKLPSGDQARMRQLELFARQVEEEL